MLLEDNFDGSCEDSVPQKVAGSLLERERTSISGLVTKGDLAKLKKEIRIPVCSPIAKTITYQNYNFFFASDISMVSSIPASLTHTQNISILEDSAALHLQVHLDKDSANEQMNQDSEQISLTEPIQRKKI